jgi:hypothetical protein
MSDRQLYDPDFHAWANEQASLLRAGRLSEADVEHIAEEIESMGKSEKRELVNRLTVLLLHMLRWRHQPALRGNNWRLAPEEQCDQVEEHLADSPSLRGSLREAIVVSYRRAILGAARETGFDRCVFAVACPWSFDQIIDANFCPEANN